MPTLEKSDINRTFLVDDNIERMLIKNVVFLYLIHLRL